MPTNRLYDSESIADNPYQLPVDAPQFDTQAREPVAREPLRFTIHPDSMTPGPPSGAVAEADQPAYKLTPVDYDPWAESQTHKANTKRAPLSDMQEMARKGATAVAGMPYALLKNLIVDPIKGAANLTNRALGGEFVGNDMASNRSTSSDIYRNEAGDIGKALGAASLIGTGGLAAVTAAGVEKNALGIIPVPKAKSLNVVQAAPTDILKSAVENTPGAKIDPDGSLIVNVTRNQHPDQEMSESLRTGVFYLPKGSKDARYYTGKNENLGYGGSQKIEGETAYKNPLVVKGATGGKAPEVAYDQLLGKGAYQEMRKDVFQYTPYYFKPHEKVESVTKFLEKYAPELTNHVEYIIEHSKKGNQLAYALQEAAVAAD